MRDSVSVRIAADVDRLCAAGDRDLGTARNRAATDYVAERLAASGAEVQATEFEVPEWRFGAASVRSGGVALGVHPGPFSPRLDAEGPLVVVRSADDLAAVRSPGAVLLLCDEIAATQFTPRDYPFYSNPEHAAILDALEAARPLAVLAATTRSAMTGAMSPFPLIEEARFPVPSAYMTAEDGARLALRDGQPVSVSIDSEVRASSSVQLSGRRSGHGAGRIVVSAHIDSKFETPGAIDNAAGVAVMLAVADLTADAATRAALEFVPFNGEDHTLAPGELAWLADNPDLSDVVLAINIDAAGLVGTTSAYSLYGVTEEMAALVAQVSAPYPTVWEGPQWPASDHMVFAMRGVPAIALTSSDFAKASLEYSHTPKDVPEILDSALLADCARFIADLVREL